MSGCGPSVTDDTWPGFRISSAAYVASLMPPEVIQELELKRFGYKVTILDPDYWVPYDDGTSLTLWGYSPHDDPRASSTRPT